MNISLHLFTPAIRFFLQYMHYTVCNATVPFLALVTMTSF